MKNSAPGGYPSRTKNLPNTKIEYQVRYLFQLIQTPPLNGSVCAPVHVRKLLNVPSCDHRYREFHVRTRSKCEAEVYPVVNGRVTFLSPSLRGEHPLRKLPLAPGIPH